VSEHVETVRQYADDLSLNRGIPSGDLHAAADYIERLEAENERLRNLMWHSENPRRPWWRQDALDALEATK
jgi:hypothetical protein